MVDISIDDFISNYSHGVYDNSDKETMVSAGWDYWQCPDNEMKTKLDILFPFVIKLSSSYKIYTDIMCISFDSLKVKEGTFLDSIKIHNTENGNLYFISFTDISNPYDCKIKFCDLFDYKSKYNKPFVIGKWNDIEKYFGIDKLNDIEDDYYIINSLENFAFVDEDCNDLKCSRTSDKGCIEIKDCPALKYQKHEIANTKRRFLQLNSGANDGKIILGDFSKFVNSTYVISKRICHNFDEYKIFGIQLIPVVLMIDDREIYLDHYYLHIFNYIDALEKNNTKHYMLDKNTPISNVLTRIYFNNDFKKMNLSKKLIFRFSDIPDYFIFHKSIVERILKDEPTGVSFEKISDFNKRCLPKPINFS